MSDTTTIEWPEDPAALITITGARCAECDRAFPLTGYEQEAAAVNEIWRVAGLGHLLQRGWPLRLPAWLVSQGFSCGLCGAPDLLLEIERGEVHELPEVGR
jgi:hypothetical protein